MEMLVETVQWVFSGIGVFVLGLLINGYKTKKSGKKKKRQKSFIMTIDENGKIAKFSFERVDSNNSNGH